MRVQRWRDVQSVKENSMVDSQAEALRSGYQPQIIRVHAWLLNRQVT
jgi:hypothetical protein